MLLTYEFSFNNKLTLSSSSPRTERVFVLHTPLHTIPVQNAKAKHVGMRYKCLSVCLSVCLSFYLLSMRTHRIFMQELKSGCPHGVFCPSSIPSEYLFLYMRKKFGFNKKIHTKLLVVQVYFQPYSCNTHAECEWAQGTFLRQWIKVPPAHVQRVFIYGIYLEEPIMLPSPHRINLEEPIRSPSPHWINFSVCLFVHLEYENTQTLKVGIKIRVSTWSLLSVVHPLRIVQEICRNLLIPPTGYLGKYIAHNDCTEEEVRRISIAATILVSAAALEVGGALALGRVTHVVAYKL